MSDRDSVTSESVKVCNYPVLPNHKRVNECAKESQILLWIWNLFQEITALDYDQYIRDGVILCRLMNAVKNGSIKGEVTPGDNLKHKRANIERFLRAVEEYGVNKEKLFSVEDLLLLQNIPKVTMCLFELGKLAANDSNYNGPKLGAMPYEAIDQKTKRRAGMPEGDDIHVAHVNISQLKKMMSFEG